VRIVREMEGNGLEGRGKKGGGRSVRRTVLRSITLKGEGGPSQNLSRKWRVFKKWEEEKREKVSCDPRQSRGGLMSALSMASGAFSRGAVRTRRLTRGRKGGEDE